jgi:anti-sigma B factor antagonist
LRRPVAEESVVGWDSIHLPVVDGAWLVIRRAPRPALRFPTAYPTPGVDRTNEPLVRLVVTRRLSEDRAQLLVEVSGRVDLATAPTLAAALDRARLDLRQVDSAVGIVVDLTAVPFLSAAGMRVLARVRDACAGDGLGLRVAADHPAVTRPLARAGLVRALGLRSAPDGDFRRS